MAAMTQAAPPLPQICPLVGSRCCWGMDKRGEGGWQGIQQEGEHQGGKCLGRKGSADGVGINRGGRQMNNIREGKGGSGGNLHVGEAVDMPHLDDSLRHGRQG
jgi:hypothetical protein